jgi:hypothetical protein
MGTVVKSTIKHLVNGTSIILQHLSKVLLKTFSKRHQHHLARVVKSAIKHLVNDPTII